MLNPAWIQSPKGKSPNVQYGYSEIQPAQMQAAQIALSEEGHFVWFPGCSFDRTSEFPGGRYLGCGLLGCGTYGKVIECLDQKHNGRVAIKAVRRGCPAFRAAAEREVLILRDLDGQSHTPKLLRDFEHSGHICMVFDVFGDSLKFLLDKRWEFLTY